MKWKIRRNRGGSGKQQVGLGTLASRGLPEAHLVAHLCATQWLSPGQPPQGGWPLEGHWCYVCRVQRPVRSWSNSYARFCKKQHENAIDGPLEPKSALHSYTLERKILFNEQTHPGGNEITVEKKASYTINTIKNSHSIWTVNLPSISSQKSENAKHHEHIQSQT